MRLMRFSNELELPLGRGLIDKSDLKIAATPPPLHVLREI